MKLSLLEAELVLYALRLVDSSTELLAKAYGECTEGSEFSKKLLDPVTGGFNHNSITDSKKAMIKLRMVLDILKIKVRGACKATWKGEVAEEANKILEDLEKDLPDAA